MGPVFDDGVGSDSPVPELSGVSCPYRLSDSESGEGPDPLGVQSRL